MRRRRPLAVIVTAVALASLVGACGDSDDEDGKPTATPPASETPFGGSGPTPPSASQLPPEFIQCMADQGFEIQSPDEIHSAPQQALQTCFGSLHSGGGTP